MSARACRSEIGRMGDRDVEETCPDEGNRLSKNVLLFQPFHSILI
jgi:hypothetical protein